MVTEALAAAGRDPTGLAGGRVARWGGNARMGGRDLYVVEADEYDRAFLSLAPAVAVVNNVEADHLECYDGSVAALEQAFAQFAGRARRVIAGGDDAGALRVVSAVRAPVWRVGLGADVDVRIADAQLDEQGSTARIELPDGGGGARALTLRLRVPGLHNVRNAAAALAGADVVVGAPIYGAREQPLPGVSAALVARGAVRAGATTVALRERATLTERVAETVQAGDVVFTLGAGDITRVGPELLARLGTGAGAGAGAGRDAGRGGGSGRCWASRDRGCPWRPGAAGRSPPRDRGLTCRSR